MACLTCTGPQGKCHGGSWQLTPRELEVLELVVAGHSNAAIAVCLGMAGRTAQSHLRNLMEKSGTSSRTQLAVCALRRGLITPGACGCPAGHTVNTIQRGTPS